MENFALVALWMNSWIGLEMQDNVAVFHSRVLVLKSFGEHFEQFFFLFPLRGALLLLATKSIRMAQDILDSFVFFLASVSSQGLAICREHPMNVAITRFHNFPQ